MDPRTEKMLEQRRHSQETSSPSARRCPFCAEEIQPAAIVCKHCHRDLAVALSQTTATTLAQRSAARTQLGFRHLFGMLAVLVGTLLAITAGRTVGPGFVLSWVGFGLMLTGSAIPRWGGAFVAALAVSAVGVGIGNSGLGSTTAASQRVSQSARTIQGKQAPTVNQAPSVNEDPVLDLLSSRGYQERAYHYVTGEVKNISQEPLKNVALVVSWYTAAGDFVKTDDALIEFNPILPGQTSPFKSMTSSNPAMTNYSITFKRLLGGTLQTKDSRSK